MKKYFILFCIFFLASCQQRKNVTIDSIEVLYYNSPIIHTEEPMRCSDLVYKPLTEKDTCPVHTGGGIYYYETAIYKGIITDKDILQEIVNEIQHFKSRKGYDSNIGMKCYVNYSNGEMDSLCIAQSPLHGSYRGEFMQFTNKFVYLIRKNCGFYRRMSVDLMVYFDELNDTTFTREKVVSISGEEY